MGSSVLLLSYVENVFLHEDDSFGSGEQSKPNPHLMASSGVEKDRQNVTMVQSRQHSCYYLNSLLPFHLPRYNLYSDLYDHPHDKLYCDHCKHSSQPLILKNSYLSLSLCSRSFKVNISYSSICPVVTSWQVSRLGTIFWVRGTTSASNSGPISYQRCSVDLSLGGTSEVGQQYLTSLSTLSNHSILSGVASCI